MRRFTMLSLLHFGFLTLGGCSVLEDTLESIDSNEQNSPQVENNEEDTTVEDDGTSDDSVDDDPSSEDDAQSVDDTTDDNDEGATQDDNDTNTGDTDGDTSDDSTDVIDADELHLSFASHELSGTQLHMSVRLRNNTGATIEGLNNVNIVARTSGGDLALDAHFPSINLDSPIADGMSRSAVLTFNSGTYDYETFNTTGSVALNHDFGYDPVFSD